MSRRRRPQRAQPAKTTPRNCLGNFAVDKRQAQPAAYEVMSAETFFSQMEA
jgi:hypothetical protein